MKTKILYLILLPFIITSTYAENKICPIMVEDEIDPEEVVEYEGKKVFFCCTTCVKAWKKDPKYYIKVMMNTLPQFKEMEEKL
ncbi:MAG: hypothetical protein AAF514_06310, partial [Verrucomicrobiota bacterium]